MSAMQVSGCVQTLFVGGLHVLFDYNLFSISEKQSETSCHVVRSPQLKVDRHGRPKLMPVLDYIRYRPIRGHCNWN